MTATQAASCPPPDPEAGIRPALDLVSRTLGDDMAGAYLFGSATAGGLRPDSDIDMLVLTGRSLSPDARKRMLAGLLALSGPRAAHGPSRNLEVTVIVLDDIAPWRHPPRSDFVFGEWLRGDFEAGAVPAPTVDPDLTLVLATALDSNRILAGPPLTRFLPAIPADDVRRAMADSLPALVAGLSGDERNVMLTLARMWVTLATGRIRPKDAAAEWVLHRLPEEHRPVLALAREAYLGDRGGEAWADRGQEVEAFVSYARKRIEELAQPRPESA